MAEPQLRPLGPAPSAETLNGRRQPNKVVRGPAAQGRDGKCYQQGFNCWLYPRDKADAEAHKGAGGMLRYVARSLVWDSRWKQNHSRRAQAQLCSAGVGAGLMCNSSKSPPDAPASAPAGWDRVVEGDMKSKRGGAPAVNQRRAGAVWCNSAGRLVVGGLGPFWIVHVQS